MRTARFFAAATLSLGAVVLISWVLGSPLPNNLIPAVPAVHPLLALELILIGTALLLIRDSQPRIKQWVGVALATVVLLLTALAALEQVYVLPLRVSTALFAQQIAALSPPVTLGVVGIAAPLFLALATLFSWKKKNFLVIISQVLSLTTLVFFILILGSYFFSTSQQVFVPWFGYISVHISILFSVAATAVLTHTANLGVFSPNFAPRVIFQNLAIGVKINVILLGIGVVITLISIGRSLVFYTNFADVTEGHIPRLEASYELEINAKEVRNDVYDYLVFQNPRTKQAFDTHFTELESTLKLYERLTPQQPSVAASEGELRRAISELKEASLTLFAAQEQLSTPSISITSTSAMRSKIEEFDVLNRKIDTIIDEQIQANIKQQTNFDRDVVAPSIIFSSMIIISLLLFAVWLGTVLARLIIKPLNELTHAANQVAAGNLNIELQPHSKDEIGQLTSTFLTMTRIIKSSQQSMEAETERVKEQKILLQTILDHMPIGVIFLEAKNGEIVSVNTQAQQLFDVSEIVVASNSYEMLFTGVFKPDGTPYPLEDLPPTKTLQSGKPSTANDVTILRPDESKVTVKITAAPIQNYRQELESMVVLIEDVTKEREIDRMKNEFISLASHQLRTPLTAMKWFSEMLISGDAGQLNDEQREFAQHISDSNERMIELVNALLNISRIESGKLMIQPKPTHLGELVQTVIKEVETKANQKKLHLVVSVHPDLPIITIDPQLIRQVYMNLITNAVKYTPEGGEVTVLISKKNQEIISQVSDSGYGIPEKDHTKVFSKFYRGENIIPIETEGTGLGLYLAKAVVESSGGRIWYKSDEGQGTTFWFSLPVAGSKVITRELQHNSGEKEKRK